MLERIDASDYQYRLAGTRLCELFGSELRCNNFLTGWSDADQALLAHKLAIICEQGAVITLEIESHGAPVTLWNSKQFFCRSCTPATASAASSAP